MRFKEANRSLFLNIGSIVYSGRPVSKRFNASDNNSEKFSVGFSA
jgi:hypothetical protein